MPTADQPKPRRIHLLGRLLRTDLASSAKAESEWIREALIADLAQNGRAEVRVSIASFYDAAQRDLDLAISVDDERGEMVFKLIDPAGEAATQPRLTDA